MEENQMIISAKDSFTNMSITIDEGATADELVHAFATIMLGMSYEYASILGAFETYAQEHRFNTQEVIKKDEPIDCE